jgi:hypothetical protein
MKIDFTSLEGIKEAGFIGFKKIRDLSFDTSAIPDSMGVYMVLYFGAEPAEFLRVGTGGHFKGKDPNVSIEVLKANWVNSAKVVYIGKAGGEGKGATLQSRLKQYIKFGAGYDIGHYGGRLIWQLKNSKDLLICWKRLNNENPRNTEAEMIQEFIGQYGKMPFANLQG